MLQPKRFHLGWFVNFTVNAWNDPVPLVPLIAQATSRLGIVATMSTSFYPPFLLARLPRSTTSVGGDSAGTS